MVVVRGRLHIVDHVGQLEVWNEDRQRDGQRRGQSRRRESDELLAPGPAPDIEQEEWDEDDWLRLDKDGEREVEATEDVSLLDHGEERHQQRQRYESIR